MEVQHRFQNKSIAKKIATNPGLLLTNQAGGFVYLKDPITSRYQGGFFNIQGEVYKILENITIKNALPIQKIENYPWQVVRVRNQLKEKFFYPLGNKVLVYETNQPVNLEIILDVRKPYDLPQWQRFYNIKLQNSEAIIKYQQGKKVPIYIVLKTNTKSFQKIEKWQKHFYPEDQKRNSPPYESYVFQALEIKDVSRLSISAGYKKEKVLIQARKGFQKTNALQGKKQILNKKNLPLEIITAQQALVSLIYKTPEKIGLWAGLPWFFQFWPRDESFCLPFLYPIDPEITQEIYLRKLKQAPGYKPDEMGILFWALGKILKENPIPSWQKNLIKRALKTCLEQNIPKGWILNKPGETWMDSISRQGVRIEIQALGIVMYELAFKLTKKTVYQQNAQSLLRKVRAFFWQKDILKDGLDDSTIRPNVFLAAYFYPKLFPKKDWDRCFQNILPRLWLAWGGLSSLDQEDPNFCPFSTGEIPQSYHQGDSWFWINNLAALVLWRLDQQKYQDFVQKIFQASTQDLLWHQAVGQPSEISSAARFEPTGCVAQAWSAASYLELAQELLSSKP